jgi:hypothetical protein
MNEQERENLKAVLTEFFDDRKSIEEATHIAHHTFIGTLIDEKQAKIDRMNKVKTHVIGWSMVSAISTFGYAVWEGAKAILKSKGQIP